MKRGRRIAPAMASLMLTTTAVGLGAIAAAPACAQDARNYNIPAGPLADVLNQYARQAGVELAYKADVTGSASSAGLKGSYGIAEGLSRILGGTGVTYRQTGLHAFTLEPAPTADAGAVLLGPVRVAADAGSPPVSPSSNGSSDPAASEGTHSYAARAATVSGKAPQTLRGIPQSISVITRRQLDDQNLFTITDAMKYVPGITVAVNGNPYLGASYYARGYALSSEYDGVPSTASLNTGNPQFDLAVYDRIEVLKGSSGLLQGSGEPGGVVNFARKRPLDTFHVGADVSVGSWDNFHGDADVTGPLNRSGSIRGRLVLAGQDRDYFYDNSHTRSGTAYGIIEADLSPDTLLSVSGTIQHDKQNGVFQGLPSYLGGSLLDVPRSFNPDPDWTRSSQTTKEAFGQITQRLGGDWELRGSLRYRTTGSQVRYATTNDPVDPVTNITDYASSIDLTRYNWLGADVNATGSFSLLGRSHQVLIGANYDRITTRDQYGGTTFGDVDIFGSLFPDPHDVPVGDFRTTTEQFGVYGQIRLRLLDGLSAIVGGRLTHYRAWTGNGDYGEPVPMTKSPGGTDHKFTPYDGIIYDVTSHVSVYASYADIFVPQTLPTQDGSALPPRSGRQWEVGAKAGLLDDKLNISGALFDLQDNHRAYNFPVGSFFYTATGKVETKGAEIEISGSPLPNWDISAGYTYLHSKYEKDADNQGEAFNAAVTPHHNLKLWTVYHFTRGILDRFDLGGGLLASSALKGDGVHTGGYAVFSGQVGYRLNDHWQATVTVNNIGDRKYYQTITFPYSNNYYGDPRSVIFAVKMRY